MTNRERAMNILHYKDADRLPAVHFGYWGELLVEWAEQGKIPKELANGNWDGNEKDRILDELIGWDFNWSCTRGANNGLYPRFEEKVLEVLPDGTKRVLNSVGVIERIKPGITSIPSEDDYTLKDKAAVDAEIERIRRLASMGGFIPCPDHRLMPGTKFELVQYYAEEIKKIRF